MSPQKKPLAKAHALFYKSLKAAKADESQINVICGELQISVLIGRGLAAKFTPEREGLADQGWIINHDIIGAICTDYSEALFEAIVKTSWQQNRLCGFCPKVQGYTWQLISVNINRQRQ